MSVITSLGVGSGLDLSGLLDQLESAERQKLEPLSLQRASYQTRISAFGQVKGALSAFQTAVEKLSEPSLFNRVSSSVDGEALKAASGDDAAPGQYNVTVTALATAYSIATSGIEDKEAQLGAGDVSLSLANGDSLTVSLTAEASSLEDLRDAINAEDAGVQASIVNDGGASPWRLALSSSETGSDAAIASVDFGALAGSLNLDADTEIIPQNAALTVNGISISSQSNQVEDAIQGVTLNLQAEGSATVKVERDTAGMSDEIQGFVKAYNSLQGVMDKLTSFDSESGASGTLLGDATLRSVESRLRGVMSNMVGEQGDALRTLSSIGISLEVEGTLSVDEDHLAEVLNENRDGVAAFFNGGDGKSGFAVRAQDTLDQMLRSRGLMDNATSGLETRIAGLEERYLQAEQRIDGVIAGYRRQFTQLDGIIAQMNSTSSYLTQQFEAMNAQLGRNN